MKENAEDIRVIVLNATQMKNKDLVNAFKSAGCKVVKNKKVMNFRYKGGKNENLLTK